MMQHQDRYYLLVHGAWHSKDCWDFVVPLLKSAGEKVEAIDLPGHGAQSSDYASISLDTYVRCVVEKILALDRKVILVGHSMAGIVISQVAEHLPEFIETLIYIAAYVPVNRGSLMLEARRSKDTGIAAAMLIDEVGQSIALKETAPLKSFFFNECSPQLAARGVSKIQKTPLRPFRDSLKLSAERFGKIKKMYIQCLEDRLLDPEDQKRMAKQAHCEIIELVADHSPFYSTPEALVSDLIC